MNKVGAGRSIVLYDANGNLVTPAADDLDKSRALYSGIGLVSSDGKLDRLESLENIADGDDGLNIAPVGLVAFNETNFDLWRNITPLTVLGGGARTASVNSANFINYNHRGLMIFIRVTALVDTPSVVPSLEAVEPLIGDNYTIWTGAAITATGLYGYYLYPTAAAAMPGNTGDEEFNGSLPCRTWFLRMTHADADSITYVASGFPLL